MNGSWFTVTKKVSHKFGNLWTKFTFYIWTWFDEIGQGHISWQTEEEKMIGIEFFIHSNKKASQWNLYGFGRPEKVNNTSIIKSKWKIHGIVNFLFFEYFNGVKIVNKEAFVRGCYFFYFKMRLEMRYKGFPRTGINKLLWCHFFTNWQKKPLFIWHHPKTSRDFAYVNSFRIRIVVGTSARKLKKAFNSIG